MTGAGQGISRVTWDDIEFLGFSSAAAEEDDVIVEEVEVSA